MSILIKGMKMPNDGNWKTVRIYPDGTCVLPNWQGDCEILKGVKAVEIPPHGRLIDEAELKTKLNNIHDFLLGDCEFSELARSDKARIDELTNCIAEVVNAPTVIESEEDKEQEHE